MNRNVFAQLRTLIYVTIVSMLSMSLVACDPETPGTENNNGQVDAIPEGGTTDDTQGDNTGGGATDDTPKVTITIGEYGSAAYCGASALDFSKLEGVKAYVATGYDGGTVTLTRVKSIQSGEGILLKGAPGDHKVPVIEHSNDNTLNLLVGVQGDAAVQAKSEDGLYDHYYWNAADTRFEPIEGTMTLSNSAYIQVPAEWKSWSGTELRFDDGEFANTEHGR